MEQVPKQPNSSRRDFIKKMGGLATSVALGDIRLDFEKEKQEADRERIQAIIAECREIIERKEYWRILDNPYLVSILYYSKTAADKMASLPYEYPSEEIAVAVYPLITQEFREGYLNFLKNFFAQRGESEETITEENTSSPLDSIDWRGAKEGALDYHEGALDLFIDEGSPIRSISGGIVVLAENGWKKENNMSTSSARGGNTVIIFNPWENSFYRYAHLEKTAVKTGTIIANGAEIGFIGHTGVNASRPEHGGHLHFEINYYDLEQNVMKPKRLSELQEKIRGLEGEGN